MGSAWCTGCKTDVPIASAVEGLPCPQCGKTEYVILASDNESSIAISDAKAELLMQQGRRTDKETQSSESENRVRVSFLPHDMRHSFATALYDAGVPVKAAQYFLGHSDLKITLELYTHLSRERAAASNLQMVSYLDNWLEMKNLDAVKNAALEGEIEL
jgi:hypothetical protein